MTDPTKAPDEPRAVTLQPSELKALGVTVGMIQGGPSSSEEAVVFLHGIPGSAEDWKALLPPVATFSRAVAFDLPGYGGSDRPTEWDYSPGTYATFIAAALSELGIRRAHLVMHDLGGVGALWGVAHSEAFASAVLINTGIFLEFQWHPFARMNRVPVLGSVAARLVTRASFRTAMEYFNPQPRKLPAEHIERWWRSYDWQTRRAGLRFYRACPPEFMERLAPPLRALDRPALVVWGAHDRFLPIEQAKRQRESFPGAEIVIFQDSGHWPFLDDPKRAEETIVRFLRRQVGAVDVARG